MGENLGTIQSEAKFLFSCEREKPEKLCISKTQWWDRHIMDVSIPKRRKQKEKRGNGSQINIKPSMGNSIRS